MTILDPVRKREQAMEQLKVANAIRLDRANLKRDIKGRRKNFVDVLMAVPTYAENMKLFDLIICIPKFGRVKADNVMKQMKLSPAKTLGELTERQLGELISRLTHY